MIELELQQVDHDISIGASCGYIEPNVTEDTMLTLNGELIGFYLSDISKYSIKLKKLLDVANNEFLGDNVPKSDMRRSNGVEQRSTILGFIPAKPNFKRAYHSVSSVHQVESARNYVKAMILASNESMEVIRQIAPDIYERQKALLGGIPKKYKVGEHFTSSISNYNIAANFHRDTGNIKDSINVILTKRRLSEGGCLSVPDYNLTFACHDSSMIVYPAWKNVHGVTPIISKAKGGYRNSLIFYPLAGATKVNLEKESS
jgi:hypothetical protein